MRENSEAIMQKAYDRYLKRIGSGSERMTFAQFSKMHYGKYPQQLDTERTKSTSRYLRNSGLSDSDINRLRGRK